MSRSPFTCSTEYAEALPFWLEAQALGGVIPSPGAKAIGYSGDLSREQFLAFLNRKHGKTGEAVGSQHEKSLEWVRCDILSVHHSVNEVLALQPTREAATALFRQVVTPSYVDAQAAAATACFGRFKVGGEKRLAKAEPLTMGVPHLTARQVNGVAQFSAHVHMVSLQPVIITESGLIRSEAQPQSRDWIRPLVNEVFQRGMAARLQALGYRAEYREGRCVVDGIKPEFSRAVTGARAEQIDAFLKANGLPSTPASRRIAALKTAAEKPTWTTLDEVRATLDKSLAVAQAASRKHGQTLAATLARPTLDQEAARKAFAEYAYGGPKPGQAADKDGSSTPAGRALAERKPHILHGIRRLSRPAVRLSRKAARFRVEDAAAFLNATRKMPRVEAAVRATKRVRRMKLDRDWNGVASLGRIAARWTALYAGYRMSHLRLPRGAQLVVPKGEWERLKAASQLGKLYVRAERNGWRLVMEGMAPQAHARRTRVARKAIRHQIHRKQQHEGFTY